MTPVNKKNKIKHRNTGTKNVLKDAKMTNNNNSQTPVLSKGRSLETLGNITIQPLKKIQIDTTTQEEELNSKSKGKVKSVLNNTTLPAVSTPSSNVKNEDNSKLTDTKLNMISQMTGGSGNNNIRVFVRVRPLNEVEKELIENGVGNVCVDYIDETVEGFCNTIRIKNPNGNTSHPYRADRVFQSDTEQHIIYDYFGKDIVKDVISGYREPFTDWVKFSKPFKGE